MPIEDVDSNIRRNLVAVSTVILISTYLDVPIVALAFDRLLDLSNPIPANKLIALGYAFLGYFSLRLSVSENGGSAAGRRREEVWAARMWRVLSWLNDDAAHFIVTRKEHGAFRGKLSSSVESAAKSHRVTDPYSTLRINVGQPDKKMTRWKAQFGLSYSWEKIPGIPISRVSEISSLDVRVPLLRRVWIASSIWSQRTFYTSEGMQLELPALMCLAAQIALAYQLMRIA